MVVRSSSKSGTAPPPYSSMSQIPTQTSKSSINWQSSKRDPYSRMKDTEARNRKDIQRLLSNDRCVIKNARSTESKQHGFYQLDKQEQERRMKGAALRRVKQRINDGHYTSCIYPDFAGYVPKVVSGEHGYLRDPEKEVRMVRQLAALRREQVGGQLDSDDDDDEDPLPIKAEETTTKQKMSESLQFAETQEVRSSKDTSERRSEDSDDEEDKNANAATAGRRSQGKKSTPHISKRNGVDKSHYKNNKKESITWRAVSHGQPLPPGSPATSIKQWKPASNPWLGRVVFRGQIMAQDSEDED